MGGTGNDTLNSGSGEDQIQFSDASGIDAVRRFSRGQDTIALNKFAFGLASAIGDELNSSSDFAVVTINPDISTARIVYQATTGRLFYNPDGALAGYGAGGGQFAKFRAGLALNAADFEIIAG